MRTYIEVFYIGTNESENLVMFEEFYALKDYFNITDFSSPTIDTDIIEDIFNRCIPVLKEYYDFEGSKNMADEYFPIKNKKSNKQYDKQYYDNVKRLFEIIKAIKLINKNDDFIFSYNEF